MNVERGRMIFELPSEVQMAIKIKAVKSSMTTGEVVCEAVTQVFGSYVEEAKAALSERKKPSGKRKRA